MKDNEIKFKISHEGFNEVIDKLKEIKSILQEIYDLKIKIADVSIDSII